VAIILVLFGFYKAVARWGKKEIYFQINSHFIDLGDIYIYGYHKYYQSGFGHN
jgi:hypothetical protein